MKNRMFSICVAIALFALAVSACCGAVTDNFDRANNTVLGTTQDAGAYVWGKNAVQIDTGARIENNQLFVDGSAMGGGVYLNGYQPGDFDLTVDMSLVTGYWAGIEYRGSLPGFIGPGYVVYVTPTGQLDLWNSWQGVIGTAATGLNWANAQTLRIKAVGFHHQVWVNDVVKIDAMNNATQAGGYIGFLAMESDARFDNLSVTPVPEPCSILALTLGLGAMVARKRRK